jgi:hypothetical protein
MVRITACPQDRDSCLGSTTCQHSLCCPRACRDRLLLRKLTRIAAFSPTPRAVPFRRSFPTERAHTLLKLPYKLKSLLELVLQQATSFRFLARTAWSIPIVRAWTSTAFLKIRWIWRARSASTGDDQARPRTLLTKKKKPAGFYSSRLFYNPAASYFPTASRQQ